MAYTAAKNGCKGLVRSGVVQLSSSNIRVNAVAPGTSTTGIFATFRLAEEGVEYHLEKTAEEIPNDAALGEVAVFLSLDLAVVINGQVIVADSEKSVAASGGAVL
ncbi:hypothetical protein AAEP93_001888 [Penicillium crustosum]